jgi:alpha-beta hydrolase superfamily lysophospholipase
MELTIEQSGVRRLECTVSAGEILPGEAFGLGVRIVLPPDGASSPKTMFYCLPGGYMNLAYFDLGEAGDRRFSLAEALALQGFVVVLADHPGIGGSTMPRDEWSLTPELLAKAHTAAARRVIAGLREGTLVPGLDALPGLVAFGCGHSMGAVICIEMQGAGWVFSGLVLLGYGTGGLPDVLPPEAVENARDPDWLRTYLPQLARERFGTARIDPQAGKEKRRGRGQGSPSFHSDNADPDGKLALRAAGVPLLTLPGLLSMFPGISDRPSAAIDVPVLVVTGTHDFVEAGEALHAQFSACPALEIYQPGDTGHNLFIFPSREESFARIAAWGGRFSRYTAETVR